jgi:hypothetical protein
MEPEPGPEPEPEPEPEINPYSPNPNKLNLFKGRKIEKGTVVGVKDDKDNKFYYGQITNIFDKNMVRVAYLKENKDKKIVGDTRIVNLRNPNEVRPGPAREGALNNETLSWEALYELEKLRAKMKPKRKKKSKKHKKSNRKKKR